MSTGNLILPVTCPRCDGEKYITAFRHVVSGRCFLCLGAGVVSRAVSDKFTGKGPLPAHYKRADLGTFGSALISRDNVGFTAQLAIGQVWFSVKNGRVCEVIVSDGIIKLETEITAALQGALKA